MMMSYDEKIRNYTRMSQMTVTIQIHYITIKNDGRILLRGSFPLKRRKPEEVAYEFWKWIKKEMPVEITIEQVIAEGEDITELVKDLDEAPLN
jgi:hypothetical protein